MNKFTHIITSGCSFSDISNGYTWPLHLSSSYNISSCHTGLSSQGNGLIARKALYAVHRALMQGINPEEILVGIMWSGPDRHDTYFSTMSDQLKDDVKKIDTMRINPTSFVEGDSGGWLIMNNNWKEKTSRIYYSHLHDFINHRINTYEKILWVQSQLKVLGINYFMVPYTNEVFNDITPDTNNYIHTNPNLLWMKNLVDWSHWLPVKSMHDWCYKYWTDDDFGTMTFQRIEDGVWITWPDNHPTEIMHKRFVEEIVLPHIETSFPNYFCPDFVEYKK